MNRNLERGDSMMESKGYQPEAMSSGIESEAKMPYRDRDEPDGEMIHPGDSETRYISDDTVCDGPTKIRKVSIEQLDYGYIVQVGCQTVAVETHEKLVANLLKYLENPSKFERNWFKEKSL